MPDNCVNPAPNLHAHLFGVPGAVVVRANLGKPAPISVHRPTQRAGEK